MSTPPPAAQSSPTASWQPAEVPAIEVKSWSDEAVYVKVIVVGLVVALVAFVLACGMAMSGYGWKADPTITHDAKTSGPIKCRQRTTFLVFHQEQCRTPGGEWEEYTNVKR